MKNSKPMEWWPTPTASDHRNGQIKRKAESGRHGLSLHHAVIRNPNLQENLMENKSEQLTLFAEDSPANHSVRPGSEEARTMTATSGRKCLGSSRSASPVGLLEKMLLGSSIWSSTARYLTWKAKVTKFGYSYWVLAPSKPRIKDNDAGSSEEKEMWPTPRVADTEGGIVKNVELNNGSYSRKNKKGVRYGVKLKDAVDHSQKMWPIATTRDYKGVYRTESLLRKDGKSRATDLLPNAVLDGKGTETVQGQLNAEWVTWLMGYPPNYLTLDPSGT